MPAPDSAAVAGPAAPPLGAFSWPLAEADGCLGDTDADVWCARLDAPPEVLRACEAVVSPDELERADRFRFARERNRYLVGRGLLRQLLAAYLKRPAREIVFAYSPTGKPSLAETGTKLNFNLAHSHGLVVYAVTRRGDLGVDVEAIRPGGMWEGISRRFFSPNEHARLSALPAEKRREAFFHGWTRKEACLKAMGTGLGGGLAEVEVSLDPEQPAELLGHPAGHGELRQWQLFSSSPAPGYLAALAVRGTAVQPRWRQWG